MSTLPSDTQPVNTAPSFYAIIPASVRYCKSIPASAKLLFGEIVALTSVKGYCFAQNPYFSDLYGVDDRTIRRWLAALSKEGFIRVEVDPGTNHRRVFALAMMPQTAETGGQKCPPRRAKMSAGAGKNVRHSITDINKEINTLLARGSRFVGPGPVAAREIQAEEQKVTASPSTIKTNQSSRQVEKAVARCGDHSYRSRFCELWETVERAGRQEIWQEALDVVKSSKQASTGIVEPPAALFCAFVASALAALEVSTTRSAGAAS